MSNELKRNLRYFTTNAFLVLIVIYPVMFSNSLFRISSGRVNGPGIFSTILINLIIGAYVANSISFLVWHTQTVPLIIGFSTTRKAIYKAMLIQKIWLSFVQAIVCAYSIYLLLKESDLQASLNFSFPFYALAIFATLFFLASSGEFFGNIQHKYGKWGVLAWAVFTLLGVMPAVIFCAVNIGKPVSITSAVTILVAVFATLSGVFSYGSYRMIQTCEAKG